MELDLIKVIDSLSPGSQFVKNEVDDLAFLWPKLSKDELAKKWAKKIRSNYTSVGVATALPSVIPGIGTAAQFFIEAGTISADLALMLRWMSKMCMGIGFVYGNDLSFDINKDLVNILGLWCGVIQTAKEAAKRVGTKVAVVQFNKHVTGKMLTKINQKVGTQMLVKYGGKRGGIALGKLVPFGVGAIVAGSFNYATFSRFMKVAIDYYKTDEQYVIIDE